MTNREVFAANLKRLIDSSPVSRRQLAEEAGISNATLSRWLETGVPKPDRRTKRPLQKICRALHVRLEDLWGDLDQRPSLLCAQQVHELFQRWERLQITDARFAEIVERWHRAARSAERFRVEEPDLAEIIAKVKSLGSDGQIQLYLEGMLRDWNLPEAEAFKRLTETTQRFLVAALPHDPEQLGQWFIEVHPRRWADLVARRKLDHQAELFAYVRHLFAERFSPLEAYESLIRLSDVPVVQHASP
jgi:transcriptional regulator with XRE-family HTH domain